jgi:hypothetical protein
MEKRTARRVLLTLVLLGPALAWAQPAEELPGEPPVPHRHTFYEQGDLFLVGGFLGSGSVRPSGLQAAAGFEASIHSFLTDYWGLGGFFQLQGVLGANKHTRGCLGAQTTLGPLGLELGVVGENGTALAAETWGLHVAPFISLGVVTASLRLGIPLRTERALRPNGEQLPGHGFDLGLVLALKWPQKLN